MSTMTFFPQRTHYPGGEHSVTIIRPLSRVTAQKAMRLSKSTHSLIPQPEPPLHAGRAWRCWGVTSTEGLAVALRPGGTHSESPLVLGGGHFRRFPELCLEVQCVR